LEGSVLVVVVATVVLVVDGTVVEFVDDPASDVVAVEVGIDVGFPPDPHPVVAAATTSAATVATAERSTVLVLSCPQRARSSRKRWVRLAANPPATGDMHPATSPADRRRPCQPTLLTGHRGRH
jgi:hypothetical protein